MLHWHGMTASNSSPLEHQEKSQDFVVFDRAALRQMLEAVIKTLQASANMEELKQNADIDPGQYALLQANLRMARERLIEGIEHMTEGVERLPNVRLREDS